MFEKEAEEYVSKYQGWGWTPHKGSAVYYAMLSSYIDSAEPREKRIAELEKEISNLLSCKNCPDNKGGYICQKEYEDKCLAQKIQYIKELQEELKAEKEYSATLRKEIDEYTNSHTLCAKYKELEKENAELKDKLNNLSSVAEVSLANWQKYKNAYNETEELLNKQIEATYKVVEENKELKEKAKEIVTSLLNVFVYDLADDELDSGDIDIKVKAEQFLNSLRN